MFLRLNFIKKTHIIFLFCSLTFFHTSYIFSRYPFFKKIFEHNKHNLTIIGFSLSTGLCTYVAYKLDKKLAQEVTQTKKEIKNHKK